MIDWLMYKIGELIFWLAFMFIFICVPITLFFQTWQWFVTGAWPSVTPASVSQIPYAPETQFLGLNKIILWFWQSSIVFIFIPLCLICQLIAGLIHEDFKVW